MVSSPALFLPSPPLLQPAQLQAEVGVTLWGLLLWCRVSCGAAGSWWSVRRFSLAPALHSNAWQLAWQR
jgi:hypothetical protein